MEDIYEQKKQIRREVKARKAAQSEEDHYKASESIASKIELMPEFKQAKTVLAYWSMAGEVFTHDFVKKWAKSKHMLLPVIEGDVMVIKEFSPERPLVSGSMKGLLEPDGKTFADIGRIDFIVVPGIAFDKENNRLGRGKAYYDRFLKHTNALKAGICFEFQLFDEVPADFSDVKMDRVITEAN